MKKTVIISLTAVAAAAAVICLILLLKRYSGHVSKMAAPAAAETATTETMPAAAETVATVTAPAAAAASTSAPEPQTAEETTEWVTLPEQHTELQTEASVQEYLPEKQTYTETLSEIDAPKPEEETGTNHVHEWVLVQAAYDEQVLKAAAYDEQVQTGTKIIIDRDAYDEQVDNGYYESHIICDCGLDITETFGSTNDPAFWEHQDTHFDIMSGWHNEAVWIPVIQNIHHEAVTREEPVYEVIHHDAVYETVHHDALYICSCGAANY